MDPPNPSGKKRGQSSRDAARKRQYVPKRESGGQKSTGPLYQPLNEDKREMRLMRLPANECDSENVAVSLISISLDDLAVEYTALSYTWGSSRDEPRPGRDEPRFELHINSITVPITLNLATAIRAINTVRKGTEIYVWVDQLCINQEDPEEKAWQIKLMSTIYLRASKTFVWLGVGDAKFRPISAGYIEALASLNQLTKDKFLDDTRRLAIRGWVSLRFVLSLPWWGRRWVIQEVFLSPNPVVYLGVTRGISTLSASTGPLVSVHMDKFAQLAVWHKRYLLKNPDEAGGTIGRLFSDCPFYHLLQMWNPVRADSSVHRDLLTWLDLSAKFNQSLTRDIIFAVLSLSSAKDQHFIKPDYRSLDGVLFQRVFAYLIQHGGGLGSLRLFTISSQPRPDFELPSWCASFWPPSHHTELRPRVRFKEPVVEDNSKGTAVQNQKQVRFIAADAPANNLKSNINNGTMTSFNITSKKPLLLSTPASTLDEIAIVIPLNFTSQSLDDSALQEAIQICDRRLSGFRPSPYDDGQEGKRMALCMTLLGGSCLNGDQNSKRQLLQRLHAWMRWKIASIPEPEQKPEQRPSPKTKSELKPKEENNSVTKIKNTTERFLAQDPESPPRRNRPLLLGLKALDESRDRYRNRRAELDPFLKQALVWCCNRSLVITESGYVGLAPLETEMDDVVVQFSGSSVPFILKKRPDDDKDVFEIVGEAFIAGLVGGKEGMESEYLIC